MNTTLDSQGLAYYDGKLKEIVGGSLSADGLTVKLLSVSGKVIGTATVVVPTYENASSTKDGLLSSELFVKLDEITEGATKVEDSTTNGNIKINGVETEVYKHPTNKQATSGLYKIATDANGHITAVTAVTKGDITALGIPSENTTYNNVTTTTNGLMLATDKVKLNGIETGAQVNDIESISVNGTKLPVNSKTVNIDLSAYALKSDIASAVKVKGSVDNYSDLPANPEVGDMYNIVNADEANNIKAGDNVVWNGTTWDNYGGIFTINRITEAEIDALFA